METKSTGLDPFRLKNFAITLGAGIFVSLSFDFGCIRDVIGKANFGTTCTAIDFLVKSNHSIQKFQISFA